jgi:hypothetical protein
MKRSLLEHLCASLARLPGKSRSTVAMYATIHLHLHLLLVQWLTRNMLTCELLDR